MNLVTIGLAAGTLFIMAIVLSYVLGWANETFKVEVDPKVEAISGVLPGANCGGCGFVGCGEYAEACAAGVTELTKCSVGGKSCAEAIAVIMGIELAETFPYRPIVHCGATYENRLKRTEYRGEMTCAAANIVAGVQGCIYGCLGFGDCVAACKYNAIEVKDGLARVNYDNCVGCQACAKACPRNIITMVPFKAEKMYAVTCSNKDFGKEVKDVCKVGCIGCKACTKQCSLFEVVDNLSKVNYDSYCPDSLDEIFKAVEKCPQKGIIAIGKPSKEDLMKVKDEKVPDLVEADFKTSVDDTEWRG